MLSVNLLKCADQYGFEPCLLGIVADQPQERVFLCLKRGNCQQDCSFCCFRSAEDRLERQRKRKHQPEAEASSLKRRKFGPTRTSHPSENGDAVVRDESSSENELSSDRPLDDKSLFDDEDTDSETDAPLIPLPSQIDRYVPRDVFETVKLQLQIAVLQRKKQKSAEGYGFKLQGVNAIETSQTLSNMRCKLSEQGALSLPPAFSCLNGISSPPHRLYTLPTIDLLHCFDLGPSKQFCDQAYLVLQKKVYETGKTRRKLVHIANQRITDLPGDTECRGMGPFKTVEEDRQASYTGKERRLPVLWYAVMGLSRQTHPDDDPLLKAALHLDFMQAELKGVNRSKRNISRTADQIADLQHRCITACEHFIDCFQANESTKLHRFMVHLEAHLRGYGNIRMSDTGPNETMHRGIKAAYKTTNKRISEIGPQLLQVNIAAEMLSAPDTSAAESHLLLTRDPRIHLTGTMSSKVKKRRIRVYGKFDSKKKLLEAELQVANEISAILQQQEESETFSLSLQENNDYLDAVVGEIVAAKDGFRRLKFRRLKRVDIYAQFEWDAKTLVRQTLYSEASLLKDGIRKDSVRYKYNGVEAFGMIEAFLERLPTRRDAEISGARVVLLRTLVPVGPQPMNSDIVNEFGYTRMSFVKSKEDIKMVCVPLSCVRRRIVLLRDMWDICCRHGPEKRIVDIPETPEERLLARFFIAKNVKFTSIGEVA